MKSTMPRRRSKSGFTLIELLVVVAIIAVLLALLMPALDRAVYQAELATCAGKLKAVGSAVTIYAFDNRRRYPDRDLPPTRTGAGNPQYVTPKEIYRPVNTFDMRPGVRGVLNINQMLQCPLTDDTIVLDPTPVDEWTQASYAMWWGWLYQDGEIRQAGLFKLGDRFAWAGSSYGVLVGDWDLYAAADGVQSSHPDEWGVMDLHTVRRELAFGVPLTASIWGSVSTEPRGPVSLNHAMTDGSVQRFNGVERYRSPADHDPRMDGVPPYWKQPEPAKRLQIPR